MDQQHTNLLFDGMNLDSHPLLQPVNSYREALNGTLISKNGNNYAFESIEGTTLNWSMPEHKIGADKFVPTGWFRVGDRLAVYSTDDSSVNGGAGEIGLVTFDNAGIGTYSAKYYHEDLLFTQRHMIFGYGLEENDNYQRSYWTDDFNQPRTLNFAAAVITTEYLTTTLNVGSQYMVLTDSVGSIEHPIGSGFFYGPKQALGNIITASTATFTSFGSVKVIAYLDPTVLDYTPAKAIGSIDFSKYLFGGQLFCGVKMYAYQLATDDGYEASWSYTLNPIHVNPDNPSAGYQQYQGDTGLVNSGKAVQLTISNIPSIFTKIKVAVIEVDQAYDTVSNIEVFWVSDVMGSTMTVTHYGQENLLPLTLDDIELRKAVLVRVKDITTIKQRQIISNLTEREEIEWNPVVTVTPFSYEIPGDEEGLVTGGGTDKFTTPICPSAGVASGNIFPGAKYVVRLGTNIEYPVASAVFYLPGETFVGISGSTTFTSTGGSIVKGCIRIKSYDKFAGGQVYKIIDIEDEYQDYKGMATQCYLRGYWRAETYRFGVVAWDNFGNPYAVRWLKDEQFPVQSNFTGNFKLANIYGAGGTGTKTSLNVVGISIDGLDITPIKDKISGISIVRVPRDKTIITQSLLLQTVDLSPGTVTCPISTVFPADDNWAAAVGNTTGFTWNLLGPELDFGLTAFPIPLVNGDNLTPVSDLEPLSNGGFLTARVGIDTDIYSKYYTHNSFTLSGGSGGIGGYSPKIALVQTAVTGTTFGYNSGGFPYTFKNHDIATAGTCTDPLGGAGGSMQSKATTGGMRTLVLTDTDDFRNADNGNIGTGVTSGFNSSRKVLVNYVRPKGILYGGTTASAKANSKYIFTGHYLKIDSTVLADIDDGSGNFILNGVEVFGGDCFVQMYDRVSSMYNSDYNATLLNNGSNSWGIIFPCESNISVGLRAGNHMGTVGLYNNTNGILFKDTPTGRGLQDEKYQYNPAYSTENDLIQYDALPLGLRLTNRFPYMARYSQQKILGESIDNMRIFLINNFKNADAIYGEVNNIAVGIDKLFYWQNRGIGYFPIEERETTVGALGQAVQLGVGGVMQRADAMDNFYGNQHQSSLIRGENFFEWFDMRRYSIVRMSFQGGVIDVTVVKGLQTFFENVFALAESDALNILNEDLPLLGQGVIGVYDPVKKTAYHTFKFSSVESRPIEDFQQIRDFTIGISATLGKFVGFFSFTPCIYIEHDSKVYAVKNTTFRIIAGMDYVVGMETSVGGSNYVCIQDFISSDPVAANEQPDYVGSVYWVKTGESDEVNRLFNGDICKFFGIVYPWYITMVVNPVIDESKTFDTAEVQGNDTPFSDVFCSNENQSSADQNIGSTNRNYRYYDGKWNFNYPLAGKQRLTDEYMLVKLQVKNYLNDITSSLNLKKRIVYLKTMFRLRK